MHISNYSGYLLAAHPKRHQDFFNHGVMLIFKHDNTGAIGLQLNKQFNNGATLNSVMENLGVNSSFVDDVLYKGGENGGNRVYIVHTLDWFSPTTIKFDGNVGVSGDLSIITALSQGEGPSQFRAIAGYKIWDAGEIENEIDNSELDDISLSWSWTPVKSDLIFDYDGIDQWKQVIKDASRIQISNWLS